MPFVAGLYTRTVEGASSLAQDVPETEEPARPKEAASHSGRLLVRMPGTLHDELARAAEVEGVSLNQFITGVLARSVDWQAEDERASGRMQRLRRPAPGRATWLVLAVNLAVVLLAAAAAITLVIAWQQGW